MSEPNYIARRSKEVSKEDKDFLEWVDCWQCWGEGVIANCWEEFACIDPESGCDGCRYKCDVCHGDGGWYLEEVENEAQAK